MFGSESNKNNSKTAAPANATPASMIGRDNSDTIVPPPSTPVTPTGPMPSVSPSGTYLGATPPITDSGNSFLETGSGNPKAKPGKDTAGLTSMPPGATDDLVKIKQAALQNLAPLIDKLDQTPEERFKTLMMMIQASDNPQYLDEAYEAARNIKDEKEKAQALLDVVNEINYFTQNPAEVKG
jgi:hypothetical protein